MRFNLQLLGNRQPELLNTNDRSKPDCTNLVWQACSIEANEPEKSETFREVPPIPQERFARHFLRTDLLSQSSKNANVSPNGSLLRKHQALPHADFFLQRLQTTEFLMSDRTMQNLLAPNHAYVHTCTIYAYKRKHMCKISLES